MIVTSDHATGGLDAAAPAGVGVLPEVTWRWGSHTNRRVDVFGRGAGLELLDQAVNDPRAIYQVLRAAITGEPVASPQHAILANGHTAELRQLAATQAVGSNFGEQGQLDALRLDIDDNSFGIGIDGVFSFDDSAVAVFIDVDFGNETGARSLTEGQADSDDAVDQWVEKLELDLSVPGFGADYVAVSIGGSESRVEGPIGNSGWRTLDKEGHPIVAGFPGVVINYDELVRNGGGEGPATARRFSGIEFSIPLRQLFPQGMPAGARLAVVAVLTNADGSVRSNQALPAATGLGQIVSAAVFETNSSN